MKVRLEDLGNSVFIPLPQRALNKLGVQVGDDVYVSETPLGIAVRRYKVDSDREIEV